MRKINVEIRPLKRLAVSGLVGLSSIGASQAAISVNGADLLTEPGASFSVSSNFTPAGTSLSYIGSGTNGSVIGVIPDPSSGVSGVGDTYSITVDVTQVSADTDFGWAVTDGVNVWGMLTYDVGSSLASSTGAYGGLDSATTLDFAAGMDAGSVPGVGNSGTITLDFTFGATSTTVSASGDYYSSYTSNSFTDPTAFAFGNQLSVLLLGGGTNESYQLDTFNVDGAPVPEPASALLALAGVGLFGLSRRRK